MRTIWVVQTNVEPESTSPSALRHACAVEQRPFYEIAVIPGSTVLPAMPTIDGPVVFHGRTTLILQAFEHPQWRRGIFFDPRHFQHRAYAAAYGDQLLNAEAEITTWEDLLRQPRAPEERVFLKPNDDFKRFTGGIFSFAECFTLYQRLRSIKQPIEPTSELLSASPVKSMQSGVCSLWMVGSLVAACTDRVVMRTFLTISWSLRKRLSHNGCLPAFSFLM